jgi:RHS repeat-associated protein
VVDVRHFDADLGLIRIGVRDYDPYVGEFLTPDMLFLEDIALVGAHTTSGNLFSYCSNDPIGRLDPTGSQDFATAAAGAGAVGSGVGGGVLVSEGTLAILSTTAVVGLGVGVVVIGGVLFYHHFKRPEAYTLEIEDTTIDLPAPPDHIAPHEPGRYDPNDPRWNQDKQAGGQKPTTPGVSGVPRLDRNRPKDKDDDDKLYVRIRHYTNAKGLRGIQASGVIKAYDGNMVFAESVNKPMLSPRDAEERYQLPRGHGRHVVETDVLLSRVNLVFNPRTQDFEIRIVGDVPLRNPSYPR